MAETYLDDLRMFDEDTGEAVRCMYCGADDDCPHLFAVLDRSFLECRSGFLAGRLRELRVIVETAFREHLINDQTSDPQWEDGDLNELWAEVQHDSESDEIWLDGDVFYRLLIEVFFKAGAEEYPGSIDDDCGPGFSSAMTVLYADDPKTTFAKSKKILLKMLGSIEAP